MAKSKIILGDEVLIDLTADTVNPGALEEGVTAHDAAGESITGTFTIRAELTEQEQLIAQIAAALEGKAAGGGTAEPEYKTLYQRVEYIESAEEETYPYIFTDFYADNESGVEVIASFPKLQDRIPMGSREDGNATRFYCVYPLSTSSVYYGFGSGVTISCALKTNTIYRLQTNFLNSRLVNVYDEVGTRKASGSISGTITKHTVPVAIFGYTSGTTGNVNSKREYRFCGARLSQRNEVVREYVPCYRKSDGVVGVYEKFTDTFLTSEVSAFAKGADVEW